MALRLLTSLPAHKLYLEHWTKILHNLCFRSRTTSTIQQLFSNDFICISSGLKAARTNDFSRYRHFTAYQMAFLNFSIMILHSSIRHIQPPPLVESSHSLVETKQFSVLTNQITKNHLLVFHHMIWCCMIDMSWENGSFIGIMAA